MTHVQGYSVYNYVERRLASLSKILARLVLSHDFCSTHLDASWKTIDIDLEKRNFKTAGGIVYKT